MSGHTGKMTSEAIAERGPRMVLYQIVSKRRDRGMLVIARYGQSPFTDRKAEVFNFSFAQIARSYSLSYLMRVAFGNLNLMADAKPDTRMGINS